MIISMIKKISYFLHGKVFWTKNVPKTFQVPVNPVAPVVAKPQTPAAPSKKADQIQNLDWWQTPLKFKRRDVDNLEVDVINSGGADKLYQ
jgi:hypothetical protein